MVVELLLGEHSYTTTDPVLSSKTKFENEVGIVQAGELQIYGSLVIDPVARHVAPKCEAAPMFEA